MNAEQLGDEFAWWGIPAPHTIQIEPELEHIHCAWAGGRHLDLKYVNKMWDATARGAGNVLGTWRGVSLASVIQQFATALHQVL
jgi:hypothetical protein